MPKKAPEGQRQTLMFSATFPDEVQTSAQEFLADDYLFLTIGGDDDEVLGMKLTVEVLEKERDFYFDKLRDVEVMCQENEATGGDVIRKVLEILYQTEDGFAVPEEEEGVPPPPEEGDEEY